MKVSVVILAGGEGSRIGGGKGLRMLRGKPLLAWVLDTVSGQGDEVLISANEPGYENFGCRVVVDELPGEGPLAGLQAGLRQASFDLVATVPCDTPFLPVDMIGKMTARLREGGLEAVVAAVDGRRQPAIAIYRKSVLPKLDACLAEGERRVGGWLDKLRVGEAVFEDASAFVNINTQEELEALNHD